MNTFCAGDRRCFSGRNVTWAIRTDRMTDNSACITAVFFPEVWSVHMLYGTLCLPLIYNNTLSQLKADVSLIFKQN